MTTLAPIDSSSADPNRHMPGEPLLRIRDLQASFQGAADRNAVLDGLNLVLRRGEILALVGESGSGKSMTALAAMRLLPAGASVTRGAIELDGQDLLSLPSKAMNAIRGRRIAMLYQQPKVMLDPTATVGSQVSEPLMIHRGLSRKEAWGRSVELLRQVGIPEAERRAGAYAYQLSGGMAQRAMIAAALSAEPDILIADEPTTALDVTVQAQILRLLKRQQTERGLSILLITHDFSIVASIADRVAVMYAGRVVEEGRAATIFTKPHHPYTQALLRSSLLETGEAGRLFSIPGNAAAARALGCGCRFHPRCGMAQTLGISHHCQTAEPDLTPRSRDHLSRCWAAVGDAK